LPEGSGPSEKAGRFSFLENVNTTQLTVVRLY
jgi:hypothetical protein